MGGRLGRVVVTWSDVEVHVVEGGPPDSDVGYIRGDDLEKLLLDAVVLAEDWTRWPATKPGKRPT